MPASHDYLLKFEFRILIRKIQKRVSVKRRASELHTVIYPDYGTFFLHTVRCTIMGLAETKSNLTALLSARLLR